MPLAAVFQLIYLEATDTDPGEISPGVIFKVYIVGITLFTKITLQSFAFAFGAILPHIPFKFQFMSVFLLPALINVVKALITTAGPDLEGLNTDDSTQLVIVWAASILSTVILGIQLFTLSVTVIEKPLFTIEIASRSNHNRPSVKHSSKDSDEHIVLMNEQDSQ